jgi:protein translocase SecG subunit
MLPLQIAHIVVAILLITVVLMQQRGSGLGDAFGGDSSVYTSRRGAEKLFFYLTIIFGVSFVALSILQLVLIRG